MTTDEDDFEAREARTRTFLRDQAERAIKLRSKDREFHGLEREFYYHQAQMLVDFTKTKDVKHPRDVGSAREHILRKFLTSSGYLPKRYGVSDRSVRVVSTTGHTSNEIDIALYDPQDSITLMNREDVYQVLPIESVYGVIQVKSRLNRTEIRDGLANLASFKALDRPAAPNPPIMLIGRPANADRGFGLLFAYDSDLKWKDIISEIENFAGNHKPRNWANAIFVLSKGIFFHGEMNVACTHNGEIEAIRSLQIHGRPDREGLCLYQFQSLLLALLRHTQTRPGEIDPYFHLPLIANDRSYSFSMGQFAEVGSCNQHGDFARKIAPDQLEKVISGCRTSEPINWVRATHLAHDLPEDEAAYKRQPGEVCIYNPEKLPLRDILSQPATFDDTVIPAVAYDAIQSSGMTILIPYYYSVTEGIVSGCPKCHKAPKRARTKAR